MTQENASSGDATVTVDDPPARRLTTLDRETAHLVRLAGVLAGGDDASVEQALHMACDEVRAEWVEEVLLQTYLFAGFPRALNGLRIWREVSGRAAPALDVEADAADAWRARGEATCARVYGPSYDRLREHVQTLHPAIDQWMVIEGYGKVLSRPRLDLGRRELCIIAACAVSRQLRQLRAHLYGALHTGVDPDVVTQALDLLVPYVSVDDARQHQTLWQRVRGE